MRQSANRDQHNYFNKLVRHAANLQMPTTHRDQLADNLQMHVANIQSQQVLLLYTAPRAYLTKQGAMGIQKIGAGRAER
jgi:hypothetical protein